jgi:hypothetical protein
MGKTSAVLKGMQYLPFNKMSSYTLVLHQLLNMEPEIQRAKSFVT